MGVRILNDNEQGYSCLYCSTTMQAFGGIFYEDENPEDFLNWLSEDARKYTDADLREKLHEWRTRFDKPNDLLKEVFNNFAEVYSEKLL